VRHSVLGVLVLAGSVSVATLVRADSKDEQAEAVIDTIPGVHSNPILRFMNLGHGAPKKAAAKKEEHAKTGPGPKALSPQTVRVQAETSYLRRLEACQKLYEIASQTGDEALRKKTEVLEQKAWEIYLSRTGAAPARPSAATPSNDAILEKNRSEPVEAAAPKDFPKDFPKVEDLK